MYKETTKVTVIYKLFQNFICIYIRPRYTCSHNLSLYLRNYVQEHCKQKIMLTVTDNDKQIIIALAHFDTLLSGPKMKKRPLLNSTKFFFKKSEFLCENCVSFIYFLFEDKVISVCCFVYFECMY